MCNASCIAFGAANLAREEVRSKRVLEIGAIDVNGNLRPAVISLEPREYIGIDIEAGKGVDIICRAEDVIDRFGKESFEVVISTEMLEHVRDWRMVISNIKNICRPGGVVLLTTRSREFKYHGFPYDFWRFEIDDMKTIFSDFDILSLQSDPEMPGVMLKARKPEGPAYRERDLRDISLHSVVTNKRMRDLRDSDFNNFYFAFLKFRMHIRAQRLLLKKRFLSG